MLNTGKNSNATEILPDIGARCVKHATKMPQTLAISVTRRASAIGFMQMREHS